MAQLEEYYAWKGAAGGLNTLQDERAINENESPYMLNVDITKSGAVITRYGYELLGTATGIGAGGITGLLPFYKATGTAADYLVICTTGSNASSDNIFYYQEADSVWSGNAIGDIGTVSGSVRGIVFEDAVSGTDKLYFGNGLAANSTKSWDGTTFATPTNWPDLNTFSSFKGFVFGTVPATPYAVDYSDYPPDWTDAGEISGNIYSRDHSKIVATVPLHDMMVVLKEESKTAITLQFDDAGAVVTPQQLPFKDFGGCVAPDTALEVFSEIYCLGKPNDGFLRFGEQSAYSGGSPRTQSLSWKIQPTVEKINQEYQEVAASAFWEHKYITSAPVGNDQEVNNQSFVYFWDYDAWGMYNNIPASKYAIFRGTDKEEFLCFGSATEAKVFKFNKTFSDNGFGYTRSWKTWRNGLGNPAKFKKFGTLEVKGAMGQNSNLTVKITVDYTTVEYQITSDQLIEDTGGGYIAEDYMGDAYIGGEESDVVTPMYRYQAELDFTPLIHSGQEVQIEFTNDGDGEPWMVDYYGFDWEFEPLRYMPPAYRVDPSV